MNPKPSKQEADGMALAEEYKALAKQKENLNMKTYAVEIRDRGTCIPAAVLVFQARNPAEVALYRKSGWGHGGCMLLRLDTGEGHADPYAWGKDGTRTMVMAAEWVQAAWRDYLDHAGLSPHPFYTGRVIDVRVIAGEVAEASVAEWRAELDGVPELQSEYEPKGSACEAMQRSIQEAGFALDRNTVARKGQRVTREDGTHICTLARDLVRNRPIFMEDFEDWKIKPPETGDRVKDFVLRDGALFMREHPQHLMQICIEGKWLPDNEYPAPALNMPFDREPVITINGAPLTAAQAMTIRVALASMSTDCGDDAHGKTMAEGYETARAQIHKLMGIEP